MRIKLTKRSRIYLFNTLVERGVLIIRLAVLISVSTRTLRDWRSGRFSIPNKSFDLLLLSAAVDRSALEFVEVSEWWNASSAGVAGGKSYIAKYGAPGDTESRRRGGAASYAKRQLKTKDIFTRKLIYRPSSSVRLAEFIGIMIGDGNINKYQISIALNLETDKEYAKYVEMLIIELFHVKPTIQLRPNDGCVVLVVSSAELSDYLTELGLPRGDKIKNGLDIPAWILKNIEYTKFCIRGICDTDGSVFQEVHTYKDKSYKYCRLAIVTYSPPLLETLGSVFAKVGIAAKVRKSHRLSVERFTDIKQYFKIVGSSNPKHLRRFAAFGGVG